MTDHPSLERILDLGRGLAVPEPGEARHLATCDVCRAETAWINRLLEAAAVGPLPAPPPAVIARAAGIPDALPRVASRSAGWSLARLAFDALASPAPAGVRGAAAARRLFTSDAGTIDVEVVEDPADGEAWRIVGQLEPPAGEEPAGDVLAILWRGATVAVHGAGDAIDVFALERVRPGRYRLEVWSPSRGRAVRVDPFELPETAP